MQSSIVYIVDKENLKTANGMNQVVYYRIALQDAIFAIYSDFKCGCWDTLAVKNT
ncbi:MAG: hypothetical protein QJR05_11890 [Thermoanaerobacterium sp.]|nr:hypothetical protein [Thermoanaerobacterium sp.]